MGIEGGRGGLGTRETEEGDGEEGCLHLPLCSFLHKHFPTT